MENYRLSQAVEIRLQQPGGGIWTRATVAGHAINGATIVTILNGRTMQRVTISAENIRPVDSLK